MALNPEDRNVFQQPLVAENYRFRPDYPPALIQRLLELAPGRSVAVDLGCGPGKLAGALAPHFQRVLASDVSAAMLQVGVRVHPHPNIEWLQNSAEALEVDSPVDLVTIGAAVHWFQHDVVFPAVASWLGERGVVAVVDGDGAHLPPWQAEWVEFMKRWLARRGKQWSPEAFAADQRSFERWLRDPSVEHYHSQVEQSLEAFIACQHSRATWSVADMGRTEAERFDHELAEMLAPHLEDGKLRYSLRSTLTCGRVHSPDA